MLNSFTSNIADAPKELSWTPEMPFSEISSKPRVGSKKSVSRISLEKLKRLGNTHSIGDFNKQMDMVWLDVDFINFKSMSDSNFSKDFFTRNLYFAEFKWIPAVFWLPNKVEGILSNSVSKSVNFHFTSSCAFFSRAHTSTVFGECAGSAAHSLYSFGEENNFGGLVLPSAEAQGILRL